MSFSTTSESKFDNDEEDNQDNSDVPAEMSDTPNALTTTTTTTTTTDEYHSSFLQYRRSMRSMERTHQQQHSPPTQHRSRYIERHYNYHSSDMATDTPPATATTTTTSTGTPSYGATTGTASVSRSRTPNLARTRFQIRRRSAGVTATDHGTGSSPSYEAEESSSTYMELIRQRQQQGFDFHATEEGHNATDDDAEEEEDEFDDEEVEDYDDEEYDDDDEEEEMDDGSTAVTIRAPTERRSSSTSTHPTWGSSSSVAGIASAGSSTDMGGTEGVGLTSQTSMATATTGTSVAPNNTDGTDQDELLVGSGSSADGDGGDTTVEASTTNNTSMIISAVPNLHSLFGKPYLREIGSEDILSFQLSSAKPGNGVEQLYDPSYETYWQSDGTSQPHWIQIQLPRRLPVSHVALYLDYQLDESYTPRTVQIENGLTVDHDSHHSTRVSDAPIMELHEPVGWCIFPIYVPPDPFDTGHSENSNNAVIINETTVIPRAHWVRVSILSMHQNGRDTHVRRVALFCQRTSTTIRMPQQPVSNKLPHIEPTKNIDNDDVGTDHEEILLFARSRSTVRDKDLTMLSHNIIRVDQPPNLFATIR